MPAGTGVWVVNTPPPRTASMAASNGRPCGDQLADPLEAEEAGVALVGVEDVGLQAERAQGAHAADAEHDLLAQAVVLVAAVEAVGDGDAVGGVAGDVGVEEVQRDAADVGPPDVDPDGSPARSTVSSTPVSTRPSEWGVKSATLSCCQPSASRRWRK